MNSGGHLYLASEVAPIVGEITSLLAGIYPAIQGAILADCLAAWLAGHQIKGDEVATRSRRAALLAEHCSIVERLVELAD
jgi:hypothetical protein